MKALNDCHRIPAVCMPGWFRGLEALIFSSLGYWHVLCIPAFAINRQVWFIPLVDECGVCR